MTAETHLTQAQLSAVDHRDGPLLVLAGPGSGKTRVITRRIARLVESGVKPHQILAITFTNKAAREMANRVDSLLPGAKVAVSTFHSFCARLLRQYGRAVGLGQNYSICDTSDQRQLIRQILHEMDVDSVSFSPAKIGSRISNAKNQLITAEEFAQQTDAAYRNHIEHVVADVYPRYQQVLLESNAVDFDDLLLHVVQLLAENEPLRQQLDEHYRYVLVDEYQDTNLAQYRIVLGLSQDYPNLCVTGDPDQSIYGWRGAQIENILRFERDFPDAQVVRLEENFRSTRDILRAADELITHNIRRKAKLLKTDKPDGHAVEMHFYQDEQQEADEIAGQIRRLVTDEGYRWSDVAICYRVNALSRTLERALAREQVPYQISGSVAFFDRAEVKDMLGYLRLVHNPADRLAFLRIVNVPKREIGKSTQQRLIRWADAEGMTLLEAAAQAERHPDLAPRAAKRLAAFAELMNGFSLADAGSVEGLLRQIFDRTGYGKLLRSSSSEQDVQRLSNVEELLTAARQYDRTAEEGHQLEAFLESVSLAGEVDSLDDASGQVTLLTLHAAKGLEFPVVFIVGVEQNLLPHERSLRAGDNSQIEEERRLLFVGMTRAKERLYLTHTYCREFRGRSLRTVPSDFLSEMKLQHRDSSGLDFDPTGRINSFMAERPLKLPPAESGRKLQAEGWPARPKLPAVEKEVRAAKTGPYRVGMRGRHPRYGLGTVVSVSGGGDGQCLSVMFEDAHSATAFIAGKCPLQPVGLC